MIGDPDASTPTDALALVHRGWEHLMLQRPLAAWASWQQALRLSPGDPAATQALERLEGSEVLPPVARLAYRFRAPAGDAQRFRWDAAFRSKDMADLDNAAEVFGELAEADPLDASARYNLALCLAWSGRNAEAVAALDRFVRLTAPSNVDEAVAAWTLAEILRHGAGAEHLADDLSATVVVPWPDGRPDVATLDEPGRIQMHPVSIDPASGQPTDPETVAYEWLDRPMPAATRIGSADDLPAALATIIRRPGVIEISTPRPRNRLAIEQRLARVPGISGRTLDWRLTPLPLRFLDAAVWTFRFPPGTPADERNRLTREAVERYYEEEWVHLPRIGLGPSPEAWDAADEGEPRLGVVDTEPSRTPLEAGRRAAAGDAVATARLEAVIRLREQLASRPHMAALSSGYPFDRLRRRVGLPLREPSSVEPSDLSCAGIKELESLDPGSIDRHALAEACRSALALGLADVAARLAEALSRLDPGSSDSA